MKTKLALTCVALAITLGCATSSPNLETYRAQAILSGAVFVPAQRTIQFSITRWTTDAEAEALFAALREGGADALRKALFESDQTGFVTMEGQSNLRLRYARASLANGKRTVVLAADRPLTFAEGATGGRRSRDYDISVIVLDLDENGNGSGTFSVGTKVTLVEETHHLILENYSAEPIKLINVTRIE